MQIEIPPEKILKYVRLPENEIIIFPKSLEHYTFKQLNPIAAGYCIIDPQKTKVYCFGQSVTLNLQADEKNDTLIATLQIFGDEKN